MSTFKRIFSLITAAAIMSCITTFAFAVPDVKPPVIYSITSDVTEVTAPGTITIIADVKDDVSGVRDVSLSFVNQDTNKKIYVGLYDGQYDAYGNFIKYEDGFFRGTIDITQYEPTSTYKLDVGSSYDVAGNMAGYWSKDYGEVIYTLDSVNSFFPSEFSFSVKNG